MATRVSSTKECWATPDSYFVRVTKTSVVIHPEGASPVTIPTQHSPTEGPKWDFTEHEDGTVTLHPSIFMNPPNGWHGWLQRGEFTTA